MVEQVISADASAALNLRHDALPDIELQLLLDALLRYGQCDFRSFNQAVLRRRVADAMRAEGVETISGLQERVLHDEAAFVAFVTSMRSGQSQLFAEPEFFRAFTANVVPLLRTYAFVRIWLPGVGPSGDAYALAALLDEAGILDRTIVYATFVNEISVAVAREGAFKHARQAAVEASARAAGLKSPLERYFELSGEFVIPSDRLRSTVMLARHDPASDASINEFHAIVARGVLSLLNGETQYRLHSLMFESLLHLGFLALGNEETLANSPHEASFRRVTADQPIYRRLR
jgi:chemotaxis protein methyltransferase CheR